MEALEDAAEARLLAAQEIDEAVAPPAGGDGELAQGNGTDSGAAVGVEAARTTRDVRAEERERLMALIGHNESPARSGGRPQRTAVGRPRVPR